MSSLAEQFCHWCRGTHDPPHPHLRPRWSECTRWEWLFPRPALQALSPTAAGTKQQGERGQTGQPTGYTDTGRWATRERDKTLTLTFFISVTRLFPLPYSMHHKWFECLDAGTLLGGAEVSDLPQAVHRSPLWPSTPRQGCGSHAYTLGDIFVLFHSLSFALIFPPSLTAHVQYQADDKVELLLTLKQGSSSLDLELPVPWKGSRSNFSSKPNNTSAPPSHFSFTPPFW